MKSKPVSAEAFAVLLRNQQLDETETASADQHADFIAHDEPKDKSAL